MRVMKIGSVSILAMVVSACVQTRNVPYGQAVDSPPELARQVEFDVGTGYFSLDNTCLTLVPAFDDTTPVEQADALEMAFERYLRDRFDRVIGGPSRREAIRRYVVDLQNSDDRAVFAALTGCDLFLELSGSPGPSAYAVFWSRRAVTVSARLTDSLGERSFWRARHTAVRSDGGLPLSPISAIFNAFEATSLENDADILPSLADDVARRIVATMPAL